MPRMPEERVGLRRHRQVGQRLVAADVERAQRDPPAAQRVGDRVVLRLLLVDVGRGVRSRNRNSVRTRPAPSAPAVERRPGVGDRAEVGGDGDARAVARRPPARSARARCWARRSASSRGAPLGTPRPASGGGSTCSSPVPPSTTTVRALGDGRARRGPAATTTGMPRARARIAACEVGLPCGEHDAGHQRRGRGRRPRRRQVVGDQDPSAGQPAGRRRRSAPAAPARRPRGRRRRAPAGRGRAGRPTARSTSARQPAQAATAPDAGADAAPSRRRAARRRRAATGGRRRSRPRSAPTSRSGEDPRRARSRGARRPPPRRRAATRPPARRPRCSSGSTGAAVSRRTGPIAMPGRRRQRARPRRSTTAGGR